MVAVEVALVEIGGMSSHWIGDDLWRDRFSNASPQAAGGLCVSLVPFPPTPSQPDPWPATRAIVLARDGRRCRGCGELCGEGEADVHHLIPRAAGGLDDPANLITLCDGCHAAHHPNLQGTLARRTIIRWGLKLARALDRQRELAGVDESINAAMRLLGVARLRDHQLDVVLAALRGESLLFVSPTGSGKSLCFQLPILLSQGPGFVISPLKALMSQQVADLTRKKIPSSFINGDLSPDEKKIRYRLLRDGAVKFLYCTPERFDPGMVRPSEVEEITRTHPAYLVIDEAHCIDRWGGDFRPNYGRLGDVRRALGAPPVLAFTATAGTQSQRRILTSLGIPHARVVVTGVNRPNIAFVRLPGMEDEARYALIRDLLDVMPPGRAMLFVPTVRVGHALQSDLRSIGLDIPFYHSKLGTANERDMLLGRFTGRIEPPVNVVICTNAFGMGLDLPDVRMVIHWQYPASVEDYLQEFGRAGRDGKPSVAVLFVTDRDDGLLRFMAEKTSESAATDDATKQAALALKYEAIRDMQRIALASTACVRADILRYFGEVAEPERKSISVRIVEWLLTRTARQKRTQFCCDRCDAVDTGSAVSVVEWARGVFTQKK